jgi:hypothetical protein
MNSMCPSQPIHPSRDFILDGWNIHVLKGPSRLLNDLHYISFTGDFGFRHGYPLPSREVVEEFVSRQRRLLARFDVNIINLEFILPGTGGDFRRRKEAFDVFKKLRVDNTPGETEAEERLHRLHLLLESLMMDVLQETGFHAVALANNHVNDYGPDGIIYNQEKLTAAGLTFFGTTAQPYLPISMDGITGAVYGMTDLVDTDLLDTNLFRKGDTDRRILKLNPETLSRLKPEVAKLDFSIAFVQLISQSLYPSSYEIEQVDALIDTGFDLIVCTGSHWTKGVSFRRGVPILFGIGNYLFSYQDAFTEPVGMHAVAGLRHGKVEQLLVIPFQNGLTQGDLGALGNKAYNIFCDNLADRSDLDERKYFQDDRTLFELKRSLSSYGFLPSKVSIFSIWRLDSAAKTYMDYMYRTVLSHLPRILRHFGKQLLVVVATLMAIPVLLTGGAIWAVFRRVLYSRK